MVKELATRGAFASVRYVADADPFSNTLDSHVFNIRKKLGMKRGKKLIKTVIGRGYMVEG